MSAKLRADFTQRFVLPLCAGGELHVRAPLGDGGLRKLLDASPASDIEGQIQDARWALARELQARAVPPPLDEESLRLAVSVHDLLYLYHPAAGPAATRGGRLRKVAAGAALLARLPSTTDADTLVARHSLLHLFPSMARTDVRVSFWVGKREFHGQEPPSRLTAWPSVRRVHEERWKVGCFAEAAADPNGGADVVRALFSASPLTDLLNPVRLEPPFDLSQFGGVLVEPEVVRIVVYQWMEEGLARIGGPFAQALISQLSARAATGLPLSLALLGHLHLCLLAGSAEPAAELARLAARNEGPLRDFCGLFAATFKIAPVHLLPPDVRADPAISVRIERHVQACATACGIPRTGELSNLVARALGTMDLAA